MPLLAVDRALATIQEIGNRWHPRKSVAPPTFPYLSINQSYQMTYRRFPPASPDLAAFLFQNI